MRYLFWTVGLLALVIVSMLSGAVIYAQVVQTLPESIQSSEGCPEAVAALAPQPPARPGPMPTTPPSHPPRVLIGVTEIGYTDTVRLYDFDLLSGFSPQLVVRGTARAEGVFVRVRATFINVSDSKLFINAVEDFTLLDEDGAEYRVVTPAAVSPREMKARDTPIADVVVRPGETYNALLYFDVPQTGYQRNLKLRFRDDEPVPFRLVPRR